MRISNTIKRKANKAIIICVKDSSFRGDMFQVEMIINKLERRRNNLLKIDVKGSECDIIPNLFEY